MENLVWFYVGIVSALIGLGIVASLVVNSSETRYHQTIESSLRKLEQNCNSVCSADKETMLSVDVTLIAGMRLYSNASAICSEFSGRKNCKQCDCSVFGEGNNNFLLDLSNAKSVFETNEYNCFMERTENGVSLECKG